MFTSSLQVISNSVCVCVLSRTQHVVAFIFTDNLMKHFLKVLCDRYPDDVHLLPFDFFSTDFPKVLKQQLPSETLKPGERRHK